jgi:hypothetical protein
METQRWLRQARRATDELHASGRGVPLADVFFADRATREWLLALRRLGLLEPQDITQPQDRSELVRRVA